MKRKFKKKKKGIFLSDINNPKFIYVQFPVNLASFYFFPLIHLKLFTFKRKKNKIKG